MHRRWQESAVAWAIGALEPDDEQAFTAHLNNCWQCQQDLPHIQAVITHLAFTAAPQSPPHDLISRIGDPARRNNNPPAASPLLPTLLLAGIIFLALSLLLGVLAGCHEQLGV
jgi:hypothetical protein